MIILPGYAHILTNSRDKDYVKSEWERLLERKMDDYTVIRTSLSRINQLRNTKFENAAICILRYGRKDNELWVLEDIPRKWIKTETMKEIEWNCVEINKEG